jgi:hypothetical protein
MRTISDVKAAVEKGYITVSQATMLIGRLLNGQTIDPSKCVVITVVRS